MKLTQRQTAGLLENHAGHQLIRDACRRSPGFSEVPGNIYCEACKAEVMAFEEPGTRAIKPFPLGSLPNTRFASAR